jgi:uncharacterized protein YwqG
MEVPDRLIWPAIALDLQPTEISDIAVGQSRLGGVPDTPPAFEWPRWRDRPLAFLAQINLTKIANIPCSIELPQSGWLLFFCDPLLEGWGHNPDDRGSSHVAFVQADANTLVRQPLPKDMPDAGRFGTATFTYKQVPTRPDPWSIWINELKPSADERFDLADELEDDTKNFAGMYHQIGGHPNPVQDAMEVDCQLIADGIESLPPYGSAERKALEARAAQWRCLLQLDSDDEIGWAWHDEGRLFFWIKEEDLRKHRFGESWLIIQCF